MSSGKVKFFRLDKQSQSIRSEIDEAIDKGKKDSSSGENPSTDKEKVDEETTEEVEANVEEDSIAEEVDTTPEEKSKVDK